MTKAATHDGAAVKARNGKQNGNRASLQPNRSAYPAQSIRSPEVEFYRFGCGFAAVVLTIYGAYLSIAARCRNEAAITDSAWRSEP
jgi:hypothetical protein